MAARNVMKNLRVKDYVNVNKVVSGLDSNAATSGAVAIPLTKSYQGYTTNATAAIAATLADGATGQVITIKLELLATNSMVVTPTNLADGTTLTFDASFEVATLMFDGTNWQILNNTATLA